MAMPKSKVPNRFEDDLGLPEQIVIERREEIARITEDYDSDVPLLKAAYMAASDYIAENAGQYPVSLEWTCGSGRFTASYEFNENTKVNNNG